MKTIYTVILGGYDELRNPTVITPGWRYVCITDAPEICKGTVYEPWPIGQVVAMDADNRTKNRLLKWNPSEIAEGSIYHDGNFQVTGNLDEFIEPFKDAPFATRKHPSRTNWNQEIDACIALGKISNEEFLWLIEQKEDLQCYPNGLWENGLLYFNMKSEFWSDWDGHFWHLRQLLPSFSRDQILLPMVLENTDAPADMDRQHAAQYFNYHKTHLK